MFHYFRAPEKFIKKRGQGVSRFCVQNFLSHSAENFRRGESFSVSLISGIEKVWIRGGGGESTFSVENYLSHSAESFRRGTLSCFTNFDYRKFLRINRKSFWQGSDSNPEPTA